MFIVPETEKMFDNRPERSRRRDPVTGCPVFKVHRHAINALQHTHITNFML